MQVTRLLKTLVINKGISVTIKTNNTTLSTPKTGSSTCISQALIPVSSPPIALDTNITAAIKIKISHLAYRLIRIFYFFRFYLNLFTIFYSLLSFLASSFSSCFTSSFTSSCSFTTSTGSSFTVSTTS